MIVDEVQTGCGATGYMWWVYQTHTLSALRTTYGFEVYTSPLWTFCSQGNVIWFLEGKGFEFLLVDWYPG